MPQLLLQVPPRATAIVHVENNSSSPPAPFSSCFQRSCYKVFHSKTSWTQAETRCQHFGAHLASLHSAEESRFVGSLVGCCSGNYWIGLSRPNPSETWKWSDGSQLDFINWAPGEPNHFRGLGEYFTNVWPKKQEWNDDTNSGINVRYFVCKRPSQ
eukprot:TRINITY_DN16302_c0_g1_i1.p2 TRINITY_DN16302_c0_g1~~TRINITY_DN16302_c0_g1_i1.p2  ORF type:complete len:156 (-),score=10.91 TRINITY_DN16302_c0_g1_i1:43-510(-)